ncbi:AAA family ATPase [Glycomyces sp. MUSA5-2]|uniref:AAA family ATPase n=1 Tax=Glycomyces sp. MUSA5-2 TaxID=2053002 RepID=UPI003008D3F8
MTDNAPPTFLVRGFNPERDEWKINRRIERIRSLGELTPEKTFNILGCGEPDDLDEFLTHNQAKIVLGRLSGDELRQIDALGVTFDHLVGIGPDRFTGMSEEAIRSTIETEHAEYGYPPPPPPAWTFQTAADILEGTAAAQEDAWARKARATRRRFMRRLKAITKAGGTIDDLDDEFMPDDYEVMLQLREIEKAQVEDGSEQAGEVAERQTSWTLSELRKAKFAPLQWVIPGLIPEGVTMLVAAPKIGKTWLMLNIALAVTEGSEVLGAKAPPGEVLMIALDDPSQRRMQDRSEQLIEALGSWNKQHELHFALEWPTLEEGGAEQLEDWLDEHPECRLVIIDTLSRLRDEASRNREPGKAEEKAMATLKKIADHYRIAIVATHHTRKAESGDFVAMASGHTKLTGGADTIINLERKRNESRVVAKVTGRDVEEQESVWMFQTPLWTATNERPAELGMQSTQKAIVDHLKIWPDHNSPKEIADHTGIDVNTVRQRLLTMVSSASPLVVKEGRGHYRLVE